MRILAFVLSVAMVMGTASRASAGDELTGIAKLACEARLCLSTATPPAACSVALAYYYSLKGKNWKKTLAKRQAFLNKCPMVGQVDVADPDAVALVVVDAEGFEVSLGVVSVEENETLLSVCSACDDAVVESAGVTP